MASALATFTLHQFTKTNTKRQVTLDPRKVLHIRDTVHGSVLIGYAGKQAFEVEGPHEAVVSKINLGR